MDCQEPDKESDMFHQEINNKTTQEPIAEMKKQKNGIMLPYLNHHQDRNKNKDQMSWYIK